MIVKSFHRYKTSFIERKHCWKFHNEFAEFKAHNRRTYKN